MPGGIEPPIARPVTGLQQGQWNDIELVLDANILRAFLNDAGGLSGGVADDEFGRFGAIALYAGGSGEVRFKDVAFKDLQPRVAQPEQVSRRFRMQALNEFYYSWGPAVADINKDGVPDIVAGPYYYLGPEYSVAREIYMAKTLDASTQYFNGVQFAHDFTGDGWPDVINSLFTQPTTLYVNPRGESRRWESFTVTDAISSEIALVKDIDGDGRLEYLFKDSNNQIVAANPDAANPTGTWLKTPLTERGPWTNHGMGIGDVNKDGRLDLLNGYGWWEQPAKELPVPGSITRQPSAAGAARVLAEPRSPSTTSTATASTMSSPACRPTGGASRGSSRRRPRPARSPSSSTPSWETSPTKNAGNVTFSQLHGSGYTDVDGDGIPDFITGKRFWSHLDNWIDPDPLRCAGALCVSNGSQPQGTGRRGVRARARAQSLGHRIALALVDLNKDGAPEIVTSTKRGTFVFWNQWKKPAPAATASGSR